MYYALFFVYWQLIPTAAIAANLIVVVVAIAAVAAVYGLARPCRRVGSGSTA